MVSDIVQEAGKTVARFVVETVFFFTGEIAQYVVSVGRRKPRWDYYADEPPARSAILSEISIWIGGAIWIFSIGCLARWLLCDEPS